MCDKCHSGLLQIKMSPFDWLVCPLINTIGNSLVTRPFVAIKKAGLIESSVKTTRIVLKSIKLCLTWILSFRQIRAQNYN